MTHNVRVAYVETRAPEHSMATWIRRTDLAPIPIRPEDSPQALLTSMAFALRVKPANIRIRVKRGE